MPAASRVPAALARLGGVATYAAVVAATSEGAVSRALAAGTAVSMLPGVLARPEAVTDLVAQRRAALLFAGDPSALSHTTALAVHDLPVPDDARGTVHVVVPHRRRRSAAGAGTVPLRLHRSRAQPPAVQRGGLPVVSVARAVVDSWPLLTGSDQRAPALVAVRRRLVTPSDLVAAREQRRQVDRAADLRLLLDKVLAGCRSELELWGYEEVFCGPDFADLHRQVQVVVGGRISYLDCYDQAAALAIELDGRAYHDSPRDRERDIERDTRLASVGIQTVRFSHRRLTRDPRGCRDEALGVAAVRRAQLSAAALPVVVEVTGAGAAGVPTKALRLPGPDRRR